MDKETQRRLEAAGFRVGDAEDFLGLTDEERRQTEARPVLPDADLAKIEDYLARCGCAGRFCDAWGCGDVRPLAAKVRRLRAALERVVALDDHPVTVRLARAALAGKPTL